VGLTIQFFHPVEPFFGLVSAPGVLRNDASHLAIQPGLPWYRICSKGWRRQPFSWERRSGGVQANVPVRVFFGGLPDRSTKITGLLAFGWGGNSGEFAAFPLR